MAQESQDSTETESRDGESEELERESSVKEVRVTFKLPESTIEDEVGNFVVFFCFNILHISTKKTLIFMECRNGF